MAREGVQPGGAGSPRVGSQRSSGGHQREEALSGFQVEQIRGKSPEQRWRHDREYTEPDIEGKSNLDTSLVKHPECQQVQDKKQQDVAHQAMFAPTPAEPEVQVSEQWHDEYQQPGLRRRGIGLELRLTVGQDERVPDDLQQVIGIQDRKGLDAQQESGCAFTRPQGREE